MNNIVDRLGLLVFAILSLVWVHQSRASTILVDFLPSDSSVGVVAVDSGDGLCSLREAFLAANSEVDFNECIISGNPSEPLRVALPVIAPTFTLVDAPYIGTGFDELGPNGLPLVTGTFAIAGNGSTIKRDPAASTPRFRLLQVVEAATLDISNLSFEHGWAAGESGDNYNQGGCLTNTGNLHMTDVTVTHCIAEDENGSGGYGGGIFNNGTLVMTGGSIRDNRTRTTDDSGPGGFGGGFYNLHSATLTNVEVSDNRVGGASGGGGGIYNASTLNLVGCTFTGNDANWNLSMEYGTHRGGGILNAAGTLTVADSVIDDNNAWIGGGIAAFGRNAETTVTRTQISNNHAEAGGGVALAGEDAVATISASTLSGNSTILAEFTGPGAAVYLIEGTATIFNSTIADNDTDPMLAIIRVRDEGSPPTLNLSYVTLVSDTGIGLVATSGVVNMDHSVVASSGNDACQVYVDGVLTSFGYNLDNDGSCALSQGTDTSNVDPQLEPLAEYGGPTATMQPLPGSPVIDAVANGDCTLNVPTGVDASIDQRGIARPQGYGCDIGAVEIEPYVASLIAYGGSGQHAMAGDPFAWPLAVQARDAQGRAVADLALEISVPSSGASASCSPSSTDQTGVLLAYCTANQQLGTFAVSISIPGSRTISGFPLEQIFTLTNDSNDRIFGNGFESSSMANIALAPGQLVADVGFQVPQGLLAGRIVPILLVHDAQGQRLAQVQARRDQDATMIRIIDYDAAGYPARFGPWHVPESTRLQLHVERSAGSIRSRVLRSSR